MEYWSQKNPRYGNQKLGTCRYNTIKSDGCLISTLNNGVLGMKMELPNGKVAELNPGTLDWIATEQKLYANGCNVNHANFAKLLKLKYNGWANKDTKIIYPTVMCTMHYGFTHFVLYFPDDTIVDPLDGNIWDNYTPKRKPNPYEIDSFRLYKLGRTKDCKEQQKKIEKYEKKLKDARKELDNCLR